MSAKETRFNTALRKLPSLEMMEPSMVLEKKSENDDEKGVKMNIQYFFIVFFH